MSEFLSQREVDKLLTGVTPDYAQLWRDEMAVCENINSRLLAAEKENKRLRDILYRVIGEMK